MNLICIEDRAGRYYRVTQVQLKIRSNSDGNQITANTDILVQMSRCAEIDPAQPVSAPLPASAAAAPTTHCQGRCQASIVGGGQNNDGNKNYTWILARAQLNSQC